MGDKAQGGRRLDAAPKPRLWPLLLGMAVYAILFAAAAMCALYWFWGFISAYERSRPDHAVEQYMEDLTAAHICDAALLDLLEQVDLRVQDVAECRRVLLTWLEGDISCKKDVSASTGALQVYTLYHGADVIGSFHTRQRGFEEHGFTPWAVAGEHFDLSFLITEPMSATVPEDYHVFVNGIPLTAACIAQSDIPYEELEVFDGTYSMPRMVRYEAGPFLGATELTITDAAGDPVTPSADEGAFLDNCTREEYQALDAAVREFLTAYVRFTTNAGGVPAANLNRLIPLVVPGGELEQRMRNAVAGLHWITGRNSAVTALKYETVTRVSEGLYLCGLTYTVESPGFPAQSNQVDLMFRQSGERLLVEAMEQQTQP